MSDPRCGRNEYTNETKYRASLIEVDFYFDGREEIYEKQTTWADKLNCE